MRWIAALSILLAACSTSTVFSREEAALWSSDGAFRFRVRDIYVELLGARCATAGKGDLSRLLAAELIRLKAFEKRLRPRIRAEWLIAREDAVYEHAIGRRCHDEPDAKSRRREVRESRDQIAFQLRRLERVAPRLRITRPEARVGMARGAEFRYLARRLAGLVESGCQISDKVDNDIVLAPARAEVMRFKSRLQGTPYAAHYAVSESDADFENHIYEGECIAPRSNPPAELQQQWLSMAREQIAAIEAVMGRAR